MRSHRVLLRSAIFGDDHSGGRQLRIPDSNPGGSGEDAYRTLDGHRERKSFSMLTDIWGRKKCFVQGPVSRNRVPGFSLIAMAVIGMLGFLAVLFLPAEKKESGPAPMQEVT
jgi:hypothetical protein